MPLSASELRSLHGFQSLTDAAATALVTLRDADHSPHASRCFARAMEAHGIFSCSTGWCASCARRAADAMCCTPKCAAARSAKRPSSITIHIRYPRSRGRRWSRSISIAGASSARCERARRLRCFSLAPRRAGAPAARPGHRLATASVATRMCAYLLEQAERSNGSLVAITQESLAEELGTVREVVMRALRSLRKRRIIASAGRGKSRSWTCRRCASWRRGDAFRDKSSRPRRDRGVGSEVLASDRGSRVSSLVSRALMHTPSRVMLVAGSLAISACSRAAAPGSARQSSSESSFAAMQDRGTMAMGVDQKTSTHTFDALPNGGRIELLRDLDLFARHRTDSCAPSIPFNMPFRPATSPRRSSCTCRPCRAPL